MIDEILGSLTKTLDFLRGLVDDVSEDLMTCQPSGAPNHPAWVIGHLAYSFEQIGGEMGLPPWLPKNWGQRFGTGSMPIGTRGEYPSKAELLRLLDEGQRRIGEQLAALGTSGLAVPLPDERYRHLFPTLGHAVLHVVTSHAAVHVGQISVWRRLAGLQPLTQTFH